LRNRRHTPSDARSHMFARKYGLRTMPIVLRNSAWDAFQVSLQVFRTERDMAAPRVTDRIDIQSVGGSFAEVTTQASPMVPAGPRLSELLLSSLSSCSQPIVGEAKRWRRAKRHTECFKKWPATIYDRTPLLEVPRHVEKAPGTTRRPKRDERCSSRDIVDDYKRPEYRPARK